MLDAGEAGRIVASKDLWPVVAASGHGGLLAKGEPASTHMLPFGAHLSNKLAKLLQCEWHDSVCRLASIHHATTSVPRPWAVWCMMHVRLFSLTARLASPTDECQRCPTVASVRTSTNVSVIAAVVDLAQPDLSPKQMAHLVLAVHEPEATVARLMGQDQDQLAQMQPQKERQRAARADEVRHGECVTAQRVARVDCTKVSFIVSACVSM